MTSIIETFKYCNVIVTFRSTSAKTNTIGFQKFTILTLQLETKTSLQQLKQHLRKSIFILTRSQMKNTATELRNKKWRKEKSSSLKRNNSVDTGSNTLRSTKYTYNKKGSRKKPWSVYSGKLRKNARQGLTRGSRRNQKGKKLMTNLLGNRRKEKKNTRSKAISLSKRPGKFRPISSGRNNQRRNIEKSRHRLDQPRIQEIEMQRLRKPGLMQRGGKNWPNR